MREPRGKATDVTQLGFDQLLSRADDDTLQSLLGRPIVRLLTELDSQLGRPSKLRGLVTELRHPSGLLRDRVVRSRLVQLLKPDEARALCDALGLDLDADGSPYLELAKLRPRKGSRAEEQLFSFFGVAAEPTASYDPGTLNTTEVTPDYGLFEHQRDAVDRLSSAVSSPPHRAVLHMPTGAGKTRTALNLIVDELRRNEPSLVIWLAYSEELCEQTASEFTQAWAHLGNRPVTLHRYWGNREANISDIRDGFLVAGLGKMYSSVRSEYGFFSKLADRTRLVIIDEAHQAIAETYQAVLELLVDRHPETRLVGLTATPGRTWNDIEEDERLAEFFGRNKIGLRLPGYENPVRYLVDNGYLADADFVPLLYDGGLELTERDLRDIQESIDVPASILARLADDEQRNLLIVTRLEQLARRHSRILVFATTVEHAETLAVVLRARGVHADAVTGTTPRPERERLIRGFRSDADDVRVLCNYGVLTTGFDAPRTSAALIARPTKSLVLYSQMVGRATRGPRAGGNPSAEVVTVVDTELPGFRDMSEAFTNWEDVWDDTTT